MEKGSLRINVQTVYLCLKDNRISIFAKMVAFLIIGYALSPVDLIPDFIPVLGMLDDLIIIPALVVLLKKLIPKEIWEDNIIKAKDIWKNGKPKKWYCAIPIIVFWIFILFLILKKILHLWYGR